MSVQPVSTPGEGTTPRPDRSARLRAVPGSRRKLARIPFVMVLAGILGAGMVGVLLLNTTLQSQAFEAAQLERRAGVLSYREGELESQVVHAGSVDELNRRAAKLGMRPYWDISYVKLPDGQIIGEAKPNDGRYLPQSVQLPQAEVEANHRSDIVREAETRREAAQREATSLQQEIQRKRDDELKRRQQEAQQAQQNQQQQPAEQNQENPQQPGN